MRHVRSRRREAADLVWSDKDSIPFQTFPHRRTDCPAAQSCSQRICCGIFPADTVRQPGWWRRSSCHSLRAFPPLRSEPGESAVGENIQGFFLLLFPSLNIASDSCLNQVSCFTAEQLVSCFTDVRLSVEYSPNSKHKEIPQTENVVLLFSIQYLLSHAGENMYTRTKLFDIRPFWDQFIYYYF